MPTYRDLCEELLQLDHIHMVGVVDSMGKILFSDYRHSSIPALSRQEAEDLLFRAAVRMGTRKEFAGKFGGIQYSITEYGSIVQYSIPLDIDAKAILFVQAGKADGSIYTRYQAVDKIRDVLKKRGYS